MAELRAVLIVRQRQPIPLFQLRRMRNRRLGVDIARCRHQKAADIEQAPDFQRAVRQRPHRHAQRHIDAAGGDIHPLVREREVHRDFRVGVAERRQVVNQAGSGEGRRDRQPQFADRLPGAGGDGVQRVFGRGVHFPRRII